MLNQWVLLNYYSIPFNLVKWILDLNFTNTLFYLVVHLCIQVYQVDLKRKLNNYT
eukprot:jgi/Orpsp1_1/1183239/evm.model.c7180000084384.2